ncbi:MAG: alpha/beta hydrolase [Candidatus Thorarchaeota archaeon]|nr:MAG: alpha/beta hydrolase [Candidatus Thorarchaeota archaeon]
MKYEESKYIGYDGTHMHLSVFRPDNDKPRALLIVLHGLGSHAGDFRNLGKYFADRGLAVFIPDQRGFGHYSGLKGHVMNFDEYVEDVQNLVMQARDRYLNNIMFLFGASMGGINAVRYLAKYPREIDGLILQCPGVAQKLDIGFGKKVAGNLLSLLNIKKYVENEINFEDTTRDPSTIKQVETDPLRFEQVTPRFGIEGLKAAEDGFNSAITIKLPVLLQQAGADKLVDPIRSKEFFDALSSADKTWQLYEGLYHQLHNEPEKEQVLGDMIDWLEKRLPS